MRPHPITAAARRLLLRFALAVPAAACIADPVGSTAPVPPPPSSVAWATIDAGATGACAITRDDGRLLCWGHGGDGRLGTGSLTDAATPVEIAPPEGARWRSVSVAADHACALTLAGVAWCWGANHDGRLGAGDSAWSPRPRRVATSATFATLETGLLVTCGLEAVTGRALCWGLDAGATPATPAAAEGRSFTTIATGGAHACAIESATRATRCWGRDDHAQLGPSSGGDSSGGDSSGGDSSGASREPARAAALSAADRRSCALTGAGEAWCWGDGARAPALVPGGHAFVRISSGSTHACALTATGAAWCWGDDGDGQLGDGDAIATARDAPVAVAGDLAFATISAGERMTCGVTTTAEAWCWGRGAFLALGTGTTRDEHAPVRVAPPR